MNSLVGELVSLVIGVATGLVFERRASREVKRINDEVIHVNEDLRRQVEVLRTSVFSLSGTPGIQKVRPDPTELASLVTERALATQDPGGRVDRHALVAHFVESEHATKEVDAVIASLCKTGIAKEDGTWLQMA